MSVLGIGTDIIEIARILKVYERQGNKLCQRILTPYELDVLTSKLSEQQQIAYLAKRWCAKEAVAKALGTGIAQGVVFQDIEIKNNEFGAPEVSLSGGAAGRLKQLGGSKALLSISDETHYAVAFCQVVK
ncbi:holo-ACP synthase [Bermanella sp. R86510]|uniref:holo-ACP synthase n=1 Tax=unclassified Bermanella TaxID=2627862 RepID=UPI0037C850F3